MEIYRLSPSGYLASKNIRYPNTAEWRVIHYLARQHSASADKILNEVSEVNPFTLKLLSRKGIIIKDRGVEI